VQIDVPVKCPEEERRCELKRKVTIFIVDRKQVWLSIEDVEWALRYLYVHNVLKGVPLVSPDSAGPGATEAAE
jgi:hypothetical protein